MLTPGEVRHLLRAHGLAPSKRFGQNFVVDANTVRKVVRDAQVQPGELVCEVGPGVGSLTLALRGAGARVLAIEVDAGLVRALADVVGDDPGVRVVHADARTVDYAALVGSEPAVYVANLPYNLATPLVLTALTSGVFTRLLVMVQREVGERWTAEPGSAAFGAVSLKIAALAEARVVAAVSRQAFYPVPGVDSVTVALEPTPWRSPVSRQRLFALVDAGFAQRRKRLRNTLGAAGVSPATAEAALAAVGCDPGARAEELHLAEWGELARELTGTSP